MYETNEKRVNPRQTRPARGRYHFLMTYLPDDEIERVLNHYRDYIHSALWITHDKDTKEVETTAGSRRSREDIKTELDIVNSLSSNHVNKLAEIKARIALYTKKSDTAKDESKKAEYETKVLKFQLDEARINNALNKSAERTRVLQREYDEWKPPEALVEPKEVHRHVLVYCYDAHTETAVRKWFYRFRVTETKKDEQGNETEALISTLNELVDSVGSARDYLTHENDPDKYHYDKKDVKQWGQGWQAFNCASRCADDALLIIQRLSEGDNLAEMVREYGKDFVYHYKQYREMALEISRQQRGAYRYAELATTAYLQGTDTIINAEDFDQKRRIDPAKFNKAVEIITAFEGMFQILRGE